jgi:hypothetical protein
MEIVEKLEQQRAFLNPRLVELIEGSIKILLKAIEEYG